MNKQDRAHLRLAGVAFGLVTALLATKVARAGPGYLANGPTSLRIEEPQSKAKHFVWPPLFPTTAEGQKTNNTPTQPNQPKPAAPDHTPQVGAHETDALPNPETLGALEPITSDITTTSASAPASEMLTVTPQMVADYLRIAPGAALGPRLAPNVDLQFTPPTPRPMVGSEAVYHVQ